MGLNGCKNLCKGMVLPSAYLGEALRDQTHVVIQVLRTRAGFQATVPRCCRWAEDMARALQSKNVRQYFVLGGPWHADQTLGRLVSL